MPALLQLPAAFARIAGAVAGRRLAPGEAAWLVGVPGILLLAPAMIPGQVFWLGIPAAVLVPRSERPVERATLAAAERQRASTQLHQLFLSPAPAMELRVFGATDRLDDRADPIIQIAPPLVAEPELFTEIAGILREGLEITVEQAGAIAPAESSISPI